MTEASRLTLDPLLPPFVLLVLLTLLGMVWLLYANRRGKAWLSRGIAGLLVLLALLNPALVHEEREPLPSVAALILDRSDSMQLGDRQALADSAFEQLRESLESNPAIELRTLEVDSGPAGTQMIGALEGLMADVPRDRIAGAVLVTDGQVHDVPADLSQIREIGPIHSVLTGDQSADDRRLTLVEAPSFGIVRETASFKIRVDDPDGGRIAVSVTVNGGRSRTVFVEANTDADVAIEIERRGDNIVVFEVPPGRQELTLANNQTAATLSGVRDGLRVLLVTGRPNLAGRVWRDLLKSDPSVDLVHFTILRPPYKQDLTPLEEMALIAFPTEELFEEKLDGFDLVIFDQYERRGVITMAYLSDVATYVENGGALLIVAGEDFAGPASLGETPLASVLPALPTGQIRTGSITPIISEIGTRHTVTEVLDDADWGEWLRYIEARSDTGDVLISTDDGAPLLAVDRVGDGRVGQLMSDQIWLWARGYDGGGPFDDLIRRLVHWLMKEPELDERQLQLEARGDTIAARLRTLSERAAPLTLETPSGSFLEPQWQEERPGLFRAEVPVDELGLYKAQSGGLDAVVLNGPANPVEFSALTVSDEPLSPVMDTTGGRAVFVDTLGGAPNIRMVGQNGSRSGPGWLGLRE
ncbi:MAG: hypothetical protein AAFO63_06330, partial [Pseudomonadota bacterium]